MVDMAVLETVASSGTGSSPVSRTNMPHTPKINISELKKKGYLDEDKFYQLLSEKLNYMDPKTVRNFYMGLVKHLTSELRKNGVVRMPHIGDIYLLKQADGYGWIGKRMGPIVGKYLLKFTPNATWKAYFGKIAERDGLEGNLDPREKLLNIDLDVPEIT